MSPAMRVKIEILKLKKLNMLKIALLTTCAFFISVVAAFANNPDNFDPESEFGRVVTGICGIEQLIDMSGSSTIDMPEPRLAYVNISGLEEMPVNKTDDVKCTIEFFDGENIYFSKRVIANAQGNSSLAHLKKNLAIDIVDDEWIGDDTPSISIGEWVAQDSFHLKAYYYDYFRGTSVVGYKLYRQMSDTRGDKARIWQRAGVAGVDERAIGHPDGFPAIVYLNGDFYGIFSFQLKKHRDNYGLKKNEPTNIHLDGKLTDWSFFENNIDWTEFEIRTPKTLVSMSGKEYDGNFPTELIDSSAESYDAKDKKHIRSGETKNFIIGFSNFNKDLWDLWNIYYYGDNYLPSMRAEVEKRYDVPGLIDYLCFAYVTNNYDGFAKNWQWITYDAEKWYVSPYDLDCTFGYYWSGALLTPYYINGNDFSSGVFVAPNRPFKWLQKYYREEIKERYVQLRKSGVFSTSNIMGLFNDWTERIGDDFYEKERLKWSDSPCYNPTVTNPEWSRAEDMHDYEDIPDYDPQTVYYKGNLCKLDNNIWHANTTVKGVVPYVRLGFEDSLERVEEWVDSRIKMYDEHFGFEMSDTTAVKEIEIFPDSKEVIYSIDGRRIPNLQKGFNIVVKNGVPQKTIR